MAPSWTQCIILVNAYFSLRGFSQNAQFWISLSGPMGFSILECNLSLSAIESFQAVVYVFPCRLHIIVLVHFLNKSAYKQMYDTCLSFN